VRFTWFAHCSPAVVLLRISGKILFEPGKTVCFTLKHNELPILPRGHEMGAITEARLVLALIMKRVSQHT